MKKQYNNCHYLGNLFKFDLKMKLTAIMLILSLCRISASIYSQNTKITLNLNEVTYQELFKEIKKKTEFKFFFKNSEVNSKDIVSIDVNDKYVEDILDIIFKGKDISYQILGKQIILKREKPKIVKDNSEQDKFNLEGNVLDEDGIPLLGISVLIKNTTRGTITDFDGNFTIEAAIGDILLFKGLGFKSTEVVVKDKNDITVQLLEDVAALQEVVVSGYDKTSKRIFTGASSSIIAQDLKIDGLVDVSQMLEGRAAGVNIQNVTGTFGSGPKVTIRGASSVFGDTRPLWVIDGVIQEDIVNTDFDALISGDASTLISSSISGLNANDIEKIDILKDASATSLYGARALNGVIVITTKGGKRKSKLKVNYSLEQTVRDIPRYGNYDILNSKETVSIFNELEAKGFLDFPSVAQNRNGGIYTILAQQINAYDTSSGQFGVQNNIESRNQFLQQYEQANTDWFKQLFRSSLTQNHTLSFSGGGENNSFYTSLSFFNDPGWTIADKVSRLTYKVKNTYYLSDKFKLTLGSNGAIRDQDAPGTFNREEDSFRGSVSRVFDINPFNYALSTNRTIRPRDADGNLEYYRANWAPFNIFNELENNTIELKVKDISFQLEGNYKITKNLNYDFLGSVRYVVSDRDHNITENSNVAAAYRSQETTIVRNSNVFLYRDPNNPTAPPISVLPQGGIYRNTSNELTNFYVRNSINYANTFNQKHEVSGLLGQEMRYIDREEDFFIGYGLQYDRGLTPFTIPEVFAKTLGEKNDYFGLESEKERTLGVFSKLTYAYDSKYVLSVTGRYDGSNRQGRSKSSRWLPTGTVSGKWNMKREHFLENVDFVNSLGLRASYGLTATAGPATNSLAIFRNDITNRLDINSRERFLNIDELQNSELTWEKQYETNLGLDFGMYENKVLFSADVYQRKGFDLIDFVRSSGVGGEFIKQGNNSDMETKGIELSITVKPINTPNFSWSSTLNLSALDQKITALENKPNVLDLVDQTGGNVVGFPRQSLFSFQFTGLDDRGLPNYILPEDPGNEENSVTGANFQDVDDITSYLKYEGSIEPTKTAGFSNTFRYKSFSLSFLVSASGGNKIRLDPKFAQSYSDLNVFTSEFKNRWISPGDEALTNVPVIASGRLINEIPNLFRAYNAYNFSDVRVVDGDFIRMKNISLSYSFPKLLIEDLGLNTFNLKLSTSNPFMIYSDARLNGQDPEFFRSGGVSQPITRQFTLSLNLGF
ncbi:SusC/RagA family TonB-linked outer membrane protein [Cellulophaga baltica]|uniref:SusC/RagA family TonB-linked outer membrane protein n=2 Tax=Cellulophaga baltica TaxID=76594 RepID=UPI0024946700|nr:SusC/RagA family TonB-linked outer membrane protein [Cellulophaga baltica]